MALHQVQLRLRAECRTFQRIFEQFLESVLALCNNLDNVPDVLENGLLRSTGTSFQCLRSVVVVYSGTLRVNTYAVVVK